MLPGEEATDKLGDDSYTESTGDADFIGEAADKGEARKLMLSPRGLKKKQKKQFPQCKKWKDAFISIKSMINLNYVQKEWTNTRRRTKATEKETRKLV